MFLESIDEDVVAKPISLVISVKEKKKKNQLNIELKEKRKLNYRNLLRPCDICGKMVEKSRLESHNNKHFNIQPYTCDVKNCGKKFYSSYLLSYHKKNYHSTNQYHCDQCNRVYSIKKSLYNHQQKHKEPRYFCKICGKKYKNRYV